MSRFRVLAVSLVVMMASGGLALGGCGSSSGAKDATTQASQSAAMKHPGEAMHNGGSSMKKSGSAAMKHPGEAMHYDGSGMKAHAESSAKQMGG
jgi:hypothetical protein